jgi:hypothetical protein
VVSTAVGIWAKMDLIELILWLKVFREPDEAGHMEGR